MYKKINVKFEYEKLDSIKELLNKYLNLKLYFFDKNL